MPFPVLTEREHFAVGVSGAFDQGPITSDDLSDAEWPVALFGAECGAGHAEHQALGGLFAPEVRAPGAGVAAANGAGIEAAHTTAGGGWCSSGRGV